MSTARKYQRGFEGSAARHLEAVPDIDRRREDRREEYERRIRIQQRERQRKLARHKSFDYVSAIFFSLALCVTVVTAVSYLQAQQELRYVDKKITSLEKEVISIKNENSAIADSAENVDLEYIKDYALTKLGMVHPKDNQIINYDSTKKDYVKQYADIPEGESDTILDGLKKK